MAIANLGNRRDVESRRLRLSPDTQDIALGRRLIQYPQAYRQESEGHMPQLKPTFGRTTSGYGSRSRLFALTDLKDSLLLGRLRPQTIIQDKEQLYEQVLTLKSENNHLKTLNVKLGTKLSQLEQEIDRKDQLMQQLSGVTEERKFSALLSENHLITGLKQTIKQLRSELTAKEDTCNLLKRNLKLTKTAELEAEVKEYFSECKRLTQLLQDNKTEDTERGLDGDTDHQIRKANFDMVKAFNDSKLTVKKLNEKIAELEKSGKIGENRGKEIEILQKEVGNFKKETSDLKEEIGKLRLEIEGKDHKNTNLMTNFSEKIQQMSEEKGMLCEEIISKELQFQVKSREIQELHTTQIEVLEQDKKEVLRSLREMSLRIIKRKATRKRLNIPEIVSSSTPLASKSLKSTLRSAGIKIHKWQISGLFMGVENVQYADFIGEYEEIPVPKDLQSTVAQPSFPSDTFSLTSNPFEVADASKRSSAFRPPLNSSSSSSQQTAPRQTNPAKIPLFPMMENSLKGQDSPQSPPEEISESPYLYEEYRHELYTEPGRDLMSIAEVRKSLSTDSWDEHNKGDSSAVILLNIDEGRVMKTFQFVRLKAQAQKLKPEDLKRMLEARFAERQLSIDQLKLALQADPLQVKDEAEAVAAAAYLLGHRQGLADTQRLETLDKINFHSLGTWTVLSESEEEECKRLFADLTSTLPWPEMEQIDSEDTGRIPLPTLKSLCVSHNFPTTDHFFLYIELQSFTQTHEFGQFPYSHFSTRSHSNCTSQLRACAQHIGTELLIQGLSVTEVFREGMSRQEFEEKVREMGLMDVEGEEDLLEQVMGPTGLQLSLLTKELEEFQSSQ